ncbi:MAG: S8 family peptidase [Planctomycetota bacterium]|jgi:subtilisin family serine protease
MSKTPHRSIRPLWILALVAISVAGAGPVPCDPVGDPLVFGDAIVRVAVGSTIEEVIADLEAHPDLAGVTFTVADDALAGRRIYLLSYFPPSSALAVIGVLDPEPGDPPPPPPPPSIEWGEGLYENHDPESDTGSLWFHSVEGSVQFGNQYAQTMLGLPPAQERSTGQGTVVAVLDTGIDDTHPLLQNSIAPGGFNFIENNDNTTDLVYGHGTFVAGLIHLVAPDALLLPVVVLDLNGIGDAWILVKGMFFAIDQGVDVINLSLGSTYNSKAVETALEEAEGLGIVIVAAGGNCNAGEEREEFPAAGSNVIGVASVDDLDVKADFSNYNSKFVISAPGTSIPDAGGPDGFDPDRTIYSALPGDQYGIWLGTSLSTAFVSGAVALLRSQHPEWPQDETTGRRVQQILEATAVDIDSIPANAPYVGELGAGRLQAGAALALGAGDLNLDGSVDVVDFLMLLAAWGECPQGPPEPDPCLADLNGDGAVGVGDFLFLLANWG